MSFVKTLSITTLFLASAATAQETNPYNGTWRAEIEGLKGAALEGTVIIKDQGGTWDMLIRVRNNPCIGRAVPISIQRASADELVFEISRSKALPGCKDGLATLKRVDDKTLQGEFEEGRKLRLVRQ